MKNLRSVGVIGSRKIENPELEKIATEVGKILPEFFDSMICGGLGGIMEAVPRGILEKRPNFLTIGFLPSNNPEDANPYIKLPVATGVGEARNVMIIQNSDVLIALHGHAGTLSELAYAWKYGKKTFCLKGFGGASENILKLAVENSNFIPFSSPEELRTLLQQELSARNATDN